MSRRHETEAARDRGRERPGRKATHCAMGFCKTLTLAHRNGKKPGVIRQKGESGVEDLTIASGVEGLSCRIINVI